MLSACFFAFSFAIRGLTACAHGATGTAAAFDTKAAQAFMIEASTGTILLAKERESDRFLRRRSPS